MSFYRYESHECVFLFQVGSPYDACHNWFLEMQFFFNFVVSFNKWLSVLIRLAHWFGFDLLNGSIWGKRRNFLKEFDSPRNPLRKCEYPEGVAPYSPRFIQNQALPLRVVQLALLHKRIVHNRNHSTNFSVWLPRHRAKYTSYSIVEYSNGNSPSTGANQQMNVGVGVSDRLFRQCVPAQRGNANSETQTRLIIALTCRLVDISRCVACVP